MLNKFVNLRSGNTTTVPVRQGVDLLVTSKYPVYSNTVGSISGVNTTFYIISDIGNYVYFDFVPTGLYGSSDPQCKVSIVKPETHHKFSGMLVKYDSLEFKDDLRNLILPLGIDINKYQYTDVIW